MFKIINKEYKKNSAWSYCSFVYQRPVLISMEKHLWVEQSINRNVI